MTPLATLHHFVHPRWFEELGGFLNPASVPLFAAWTRLALDLFGSKVRLWASINEPNVTSFCGQVVGVFPPGRFFGLKRCGKWLLNMLRAHAACYEAAQRHPVFHLAGAPPLRVGIVISHGRFETIHGGRGIRHLLARHAAANMTRMWANDEIREYLATGRFRWRPIVGLPFLGRFEALDPKPGCDFVGVNYYSIFTIGDKIGQSTQPGETVTDMGYGLRPEGVVESARFWSAIPKRRSGPRRPSSAAASDASSDATSLLSHPIGAGAGTEDAEAALDAIPFIFTESGVADKGDAVRAEMIRTHLPEVRRAVEEVGARGYLYWSLVDNFEWAFGYNMKFGIYAWSPDGCQQRQLRPSGMLLKEWFAKLQESRVATPK